MNLSNTIVTIAIIGLASINNVVFSSKTPSWMSVAPNIKFKPTNGNNMDGNIIKASTNEAIDRFLTSIDGYDYQDSSDMNVYTSGLESLDEYYDSYQLAWRLLGFYVDCNYGDNNDNRRKKRKLDNKDDENAGICKRMVMYGVVSFVNRYIDIYFSCALFYSM